MNAARQPEFPPSFYANFPVEQLSPEQIDLLLENGWFRNDKHLYANTAKIVENELRPILMLRIPLADFTWKKRLRKIMRRNKKVFSIEIQPFVQTPEKEAVWQQFKNQVHQWGYVPELDKHLLRDRSPADFNTWEVSVYHEGQLVAFSIFDKGNESLAALEAAYHPAFRQYSLGIFTMLLEIEFAISQGLKWYYPGFMPKDTPMFEYKLRTGKTQFFRLAEQRWISWEEVKPEDWIFEKMMAKLMALYKACNQKQLFCGIGCGNFDSRPSADFKPSCFNIFLFLYSRPHGNASAAVTHTIGWHPVLDRFFLFKTEALSEFSPHTTISNKVVLFHGFLHHELIGSFPDAAALLQKLVNW